VTDVVSFGEAMAALRGQGPLRLGGSMDLSVAGSESNVAIGLARLGHDARWIGRVGADELGQLVVRTLRGEGVDVSTVIVDPERPTGLLLFERRIADTVRVNYYRTGSAGGAITADDVMPALGADPRILHITGVTAALGPDASHAVHAAAEWAHRHDIVVSLDVNYRSRLWTTNAARETLRPLLAHTNILFASAEELHVVSPTPVEDPALAARQLVDSGVATVVVKRGASGATAYTADGAHSIDARRVKVIDVVGAGDAFVAGYLSATLDGLDMTARLSRAATLGAFAVACAGDWEGLPTRAELGLINVDPETTIR
jgi:2-dehydro-3-deoxygluconokinase